MNNQQARQQFWLAKIIALLHDPPAKPIFFRPHSGGHNTLARRIMEIVLGREKFRFNSLADQMATGMDRPVLNRPDRGRIQYFHRDFLITHPLDRARLALPGSAEQQGMIREDVENIKNLQEEAVALLAMLDPMPGPEELEQAFYQLWRRFKEEIIAMDKDRTALWENMPADSRCPDHSIWDHNRMTSALAFVSKPVKTGQEQDKDFPWLFSFTLRPVQEFLSQARKSQDLWIGSMLLAELAFAAMEPVIDLYGPDVIIYPDLCGNPRADQYVQQKIPELAAHATRAALIPHIFVAILPRGGSDFPADIRTVGNECCEHVHKKWRQLARPVREWMEKVIKSGPKPDRDALWEHYTSTCPLEPTWVATPWPVLEKQEHYYLPGRALPCQEQVAEFSENDRKTWEKRFQELGRWLPPGVLDQHEFTLEVFRATNDFYLRNSGVLYAQAHYKLKVQHGMRRRIMTLPPDAPEELALEKCTICHIRPALGNSRQHVGTIDSVRQQVRGLWQEKELDPEQQGSERLCPVCASRRFLSRSDSGKNPTDPVNEFNRVCFGPGKRIKDVMDRDGRVRTPFPSTVQIAAQEYIAGLASLAGDLAQVFSAIMDLHDRLGLGRPSFVRALPRLMDAARAHPLLERFLELDPQLALFPEMVEARFQYEKDKGREDLWQELVKMVTNLRQKADKALGAPATQVAVITMDGDEMGKLLLGDADRIHARWQDVLHPDVDKDVQKKLTDTFWGDLRRRSRQTGPSLHAFISRVLANFNHHIAPWVVEQEYGGRLIYSGGDDLLALAPLRDALPMAARLRELFTAAWLVDTRPEVHPWSWLENKGQWNPQEARKRFQPVPLQASPDTVKQLLSRGRLLPMLGRSGRISAGIACGHFKTRLGLLFQTSHQLLDTWAKERAGRNAVGLGHFSRNGIKTMYGCPWDLVDEDDSPVARPATAMSLNEAVQEITTGFANRQISKALPYKLARSAVLLDPARLEISPEERLALLRGILNKAVDGTALPARLEAAILHLWAAGYRLGAEEHKCCRDSSGTEQGCRNKQEAEPLAGLFFCRYLHQQGGTP